MLCSIGTVSSMPIQILAFLEIRCPSIFKGVAQTSCGKIYFEPGNRNSGRSKFDTQSLAWLRRPFSLVDEAFFAPSPARTNLISGAVVFNSGNFLTRLIWSLMAVASRERTLLCLQV